MTLCVCSFVLLADVLSHLDRSHVDFLLAGSRAVFLKVAGETSVRDAVREAAYAVLTLLMVIALGGLLGGARSRRRGQDCAAKLATEIGVNGDACRQAHRRAVPRLLQRSPSSGDESGPAAEGPRTTFMDQQTGETKMLAKLVRDGLAAQLPKFLETALRSSVRGGRDAEVSEEWLNTKHLLCSLRACVAHRCFREGLAAYHHVADRILEDCGSVWSILLFCAMEIECFELCEAFVHRLRKYGSPCGKDFVNMTRYYAHQGDLQGFRCMLHELKAAGFQADATSRSNALLLCASYRAFDHADELLRSRICSASLDTLTCNMLMSGFVQAKQPERCFAVWNLMRQSHLVPSEQTFGILLNACSLKGQFEHARGIFEDLRSSGVSLNVVHYTTLMKNLLSAGLLDEAVNVLDGMQAASVKPDIVSYSTLIKAFADRGCVNQAVDILERMIKQGIPPTIVIFNTVLGACAAVPLPPPLIVSTLGRLVGLGLKPSTATLSILVRALAKAKALATALEILDSSHARFGIWAEPRVYAQLAQAAVKNGNKHLARSAYTSMWKTAKDGGLVVDMATNDRVQRLWSSSNDVVIMPGAWGNHASQKY